MNNERIGAMSEYFILTKSYVSILFSNIKNLLVMLAFPVIASIIIVWIAGKNMFVTFEGTKSACFVIVCAAIWGGLFNSIQTIVQDRSNIKRDYASGLRWRCYSASRATVQFILCVLQSIVLLISIFAIGKVYGNNLPEKGIIFGNVYIEYYLSILLVMYSSDCMGLLISSIVKKNETASVLAPYILIVQLIFSGILFKMEGAATSVSRFMIARWGMEAMGSISKVNDLPLSIQNSNPDIASLITREVDDMFEATKDHFLLCLFVLTLFSILFVTLGNLLLRMVAKDTR